MSLHVAPGTLVVFADIGCPWAHLAVYRLHTVRAALGLGERVRFDIRAFPLELINEMSTPKLILEAETPVVGALEPEAGWQLWQRPDHTYPVSTLLAMEAVEAAKEQGLAASETLDRALRVALFGQSRTVTMRHEILAVARECGVDAEELRRALVRGSARAAVEEHLTVSLSDAVQGSPHVFAPGGLDAHNPGVERHWLGEMGTGFPVVDRDEPGPVYEALLKRAAQG
ncbi:MULTISPECIES: DsbA family oxidoreductase [unclassified Streptomyces]|uniref:DsbA family oxidoreductase n=1 Tax=unclassified Streptomyces TaxID=2593676 RepID=UPI000BEFDA4F|nr:MULTISPECIES: DsbA family protein [unclassified Streptomyces]